jgi:hypothetical protein
MIRRGLLLLCVLALLFSTGCALFLVGAGAAGGYAYSKGEQSGKSEKKSSSDSEGKSSSQNKSAPKSGASSD